MLVNVWFVPSAHGLHEVRVGVLGLEEGGEVVGLGGGLQHGLGLWHLVALEDLDVGLEELDNLLALDLIPADLLHDDVVRGKEQRHKR